MSTGRQFSTDLQKMVARLAPTGRTGSTVPKSSESAPPGSPATSVTAPSLISTIRDQLVARTPAKRLPHVMGVEGMSLVLAERWGVDRDKVLLAALLHDLSKALPHDEQRRRLADCVAVPASAVDYDHPAVWHGLVAAQEARDTFGIEDHDVLEAVAFHPTGSEGLGPVGLTLYVADYMEPSRNWAGVDQARLRLMKKPPREAALLVAQDKLGRLQAAGKPVHPRTAAMVRWLESNPQKGEPLS